MLKTAIYARYSCDQQRDTSIDDQLRRCREVGLRHGIDIDNPLIFSDAALSGTAKHTDKREGYQALLAAWERGEISTIVVDDFSRLSRDAIEQAQLVRRLENNRRVRLLTANGIDSSQPNWQLQVGLLGVVSQQAIRDTQHLVVRGMLGQLERGYMIATPAFGYLLDRKMDEQGNRIGTRWKISPSAAEVVRNIFTKRAEGQSMHQIARWLNEAGVELAREKQKIDGGFWRASRVKALLCNTIYRGVFTWNGSARIRADALKNGRVLDIKVFPRPDLRLVSDDIWYRCNDKTGRRSAYGGGKHALAGLIRCGCCDSKLVLSSQSRCRSVYCANCTAAKAVAGKNAGMTSTVSAAGVQVLLSKALQHLLTPTFVDHFRDCLRDKLTGDNAREVKALIDKAR
jgi:DNA invertase Pin-like site-specific DNA recombinase